MVALDVRLLQILVRFGTPPITPALPHVVARPGASTLAEGAVLVQNRGFGAVVQLSMMFWK